MSAAASSSAVPLMPLPRLTAPLRRLPLPQALLYLRSGPASVPLSSNVKSMRVKYLPVSEEHKETQTFVHAYLPSLAYVNPSMRVQIERFPDPASSVWPADAARVPDIVQGSEPQPEIEISWHHGPSMSLDLDMETEADTILERLLRIASANTALLPEPEREAVVATPENSAGGTRGEPAGSSILGEEGEENAAGIGEEGSAEAESASAASAVSEDSDGAPKPT